MKRKKIILVIGAITLLALLSACTLLPRPNNFLLTITPPSGHPPFEVEIQVTDMGRGTYTYEATGKATVQTINSTLTMTVSTYPWKCRVTWTDGLGGFEEAEAAVALVNTAPVINWPRVNDIDPFYNAGILQERQRFFFDFNPFQTTPLWPGDSIKFYGITDPEKDKCWITNVEVLWYADEFPNGRKVTVYTPPYIPGVYHAVRHAGSRSYADIVENAFVLYPPYLGSVQTSSGRVDCPFDEWTYHLMKLPCDVYAVPYSQPAPLTIKVEAEDEYGARSEAEFELMMDATGCSL